MAGNAVTMTVPSSDSMKNAAATVRAMRRELALDMALSEVASAVVGVLMLPHCAWQARALLCLARVLGQGARLFDLDALARDHAPQKGRVTFDATGQSLGRGAGHLPPLRKQPLTHLRAAGDVAEQG